MRSDSRFRAPVSKDEDHDEDDDGDDDDGSEEAC